MKGASGYRFNLSRASFQLWKSKLTIEEEMKMEDLDEARKA